MASIVISIGGSILLTGQDDVPYLKALSELLTTVCAGNRLAVVVGGGRLAREYIRLGRELGVSDEAVLDRVGIGATRLNAMLLISALKDDVKVNPLPFTTVEKALESADEFNPVVMGGTVPGQTTDAVSAQLAEGLGAGLFINATAVDGVYEADPRKDPDAKRFDRLSFQELLDIVSGSLGKAGTNIVVDPVAAEILARNSIRTIVLNGRDLDNFARALGGGEFLGTVIE